MRHWLRVLGWNAHIAWLCVRAITPYTRVSTGLPHMRISHWPVYAYDSYRRVVHLPMVRDSFSYMICLHELGHATLRHTNEEYVYLRLWGMTSETLIAKELQAWMWAEVRYRGDRQKFLRFSRVMLNTWTRRPWMVK